MKNKKLKQTHENKGKVEINNQSRSEGITLIALVITIIILIILAGVAINLTLGENGIFLKAKQAKEDTIQAQELESNAISDYEYQINSITQNQNQNQNQNQDQDKDETENITWLYNRGNYCESVTGNWRFSGGYSPSESDWTKKDTHMEITCPYLRRTYITTNNKIDLTEYSKLVVKTECSNIYDVMYVTTLDMIDRDPYTEYLVSGENIINIEEFTGKQYIHFGGTWGTLKIFEVYLEK